MVIDENSTDLTVETNSGILNIRVLVLIKTTDGFIFEHNTEGYYFAIGGRVKFNETSVDAAYRELEEEIQETKIHLRMCGIIENFFEHQNQPCHEINFVYVGELSKNIDLSTLNSDHLGFKYITPEQADSMDIRPKELVKFLTFEGEFLHLVNRDT